MPTQRSCKTHFPVRSQDRLVAKDPLIISHTAAPARMVGPVLFAGGLATLTILQYDSLLGIGWEPLRGPWGAWPSGLSLGPLRLGSGP
jgi:hypothetical protein